jgi:hypothetical protein
MTTHETARPVEMGGSDDPTDEQYDPGTDTQAPVEDEPEPTRFREHDAVDDDTDDPEPELVETNELDEPTEPEPAGPPERDEAAAVDRTPESDARQRLAPVGPDIALDPRTGSYEDRWSAIQAGFIDDPRRTVESASALVAEIWGETVRAITDERDGVDDRWQNTESSTDDLRMAMQDYRDMYARLMRFTSN